MKSQSILPNWLTVTLTLTFIVTGAAVALLGWLTAMSILQRPLNPVAVAAEEVTNVNLPLMDQAGLALPPTLAPGQIPPTPFPTSVAKLDVDRLTILVMGIDRRPGEPFISRTDSMMLLSINPVDNTAALLSIPRDLYVVIPGLGRDRINTAFVYGAQGGNPEAGALLAMQAVEYNLGIPVDHYVLVDFSAVIDTVDSIGGVEIEVPYDIHDPAFPDMNYGFDPLFIPAGEQLMDGELALKYARTRHQDSDFGRAERQQQLILAVRNRLLENGIEELLIQAPALYQHLKEGVRTDVNLELALQLAGAALELSADDIDNAVLDYQYVTSFTTEGGASVLVLENERAAPLIQNLFFD